MTTATAADRAPGLEDSPARLGARDDGEASRPEQDATSWATAQLAVLPEGAAGRCLGRALLGLGLGGCYGVAMGLGGGAPWMGRLAADVLQVLGSVSLLAVPSLHVLLALFDAPLSPWQTAERTSRALFSTGLLLAGLSPALALYAATAEPPLVLGLGSAGLWLCAGAGLWSFSREMLGSLHRLTGHTRVAATLVVAGFALFCLQLGTAAVQLPALGGS